ncbi:hypothetical protein SAMN02745164_00048 [Marinitoga hydrogenitolerans DSM 16785]|uniref:GAF domain-containing protein n=1 Tax=Marinitoga hydrogenitolerans (strain DSM 16785 / JCM 12826 / AT1271) TaxID=1122195 RepID=A0A1M4S5E3_MARH1|nr:hypothetical protein [Marinitoga hydrogenitolerans]SHE27411.1 hypothetical protein SAMN02745164_00048 [Marinitoga hydrogenitolerans DSM 16785]
MKLSKNLYKYIEIFIILTFLFVLDLTNKYFGYVFFNPNPYFIFSLFIAVRYGINLTILVGVISTLYVFLSVFFSVKNDFFNVIISWEILKIPLFIFSLGFIIGFFRDIYIQQIELQYDQIKLLKSRIDDLEDDIRKYKNITDDLEHKLILEKQGLSLLVEKLKDIEYNNSEDIFNEAIDLISEFIYAKTVSIYILNKNNFLRLKVRKGEQFLPNSFAVDKSIVISTAKEFGSATSNVLFLTETEFNFEYEPAMAVSITDNNKVLGFITVEVIDPEKINKNTETYLKILSDWLGTLLLASKELNQDNDNTMFYQMKKFNKILEKIEERFKKFKIPYSIISGTYDKKFSVEEIRSFIRDTDFLFLDEKTKEFKIILTSCSAKGLKRVKENLEKYAYINIQEAYSKDE